MAMHTGPAAMLSPSLYRFASPDIDKSLFFRQMANAKRLSLSLSLPIAMAAIHLLLLLLLLRNSSYFRHTSSEMAGHDEYEAWAGDERADLWQDRNAQIDDQRKRGASARKGERKRERERDDKGKDSRSLSFSSSPKTWLGVAYMRKYSTNDSSLPLSQPPLSLYLYLADGNCHGRRANGGSAGSEAIAGSRWIAFISGPFLRNQKSVKGALQEGGEDLATARASLAALRPLELRSELQNQRETAAMGIWRAQTHKRA